MNEIIAKMRADWTVVAQDRRASGEWTEADEKDIGEAVKAAVASGKQEQIILWSRWLGDLSASTIALKAIILGIDTRIRDAVRKHREQLAKTAGESKNA